MNEQQKRAAGLPSARVPTEAEDRRNREGRQERGEWSGVERLYWPPCDGAWPMLLRMADDESGRWQ
jgi:hypothetical protein